MASGVFLALEIHLIGGAGSDDAMTDLSQIVAEIPVIGAGHGQSLAVLLGIDGHQIVDIMGSCLILASQHGRDDGLQGLEQVGLAGGVLAHVKLAGNLAHSIAVIDSLGVNAQVNALLRSQQEVHLHGDMYPILVCADTATILGPA